MPTGDELGPTEATKYRNIVALALYLAQDCAGINFVVKELARRMANPDRWMMGQTQKLARDFIGKFCVLFWYRHQSEPIAIEGFSDSDWVGCRRTRRSTSGGCIRHVSHLLKTWSRAQTVTVLSSVEVLGVLPQTPQSPKRGTLFHDLVS